MKIACDLRCIDRVYRLSTGKNDIIIAKITFAFTNGDFSFSVSGKCYVHRLDYQLRSGSQF